MYGTVTLNPCIDKTVTVEGFKTGKLNRIAASIQQPAGKGINSSIVYNNLGGDTLCTGINYLSNRNVIEDYLRITSYNVCYTKLLRILEYLDDASRKVKVMHSLII